MGTTAASLHIRVPPAPAAPLLNFRGRTAPLTDPRAAVEKAYAKLGWAPPRRGEAPVRHVALARNPGGFFTLYDSACADLDDGTLQELAALISKSIGTACVVTTLRDSDHFEFIVFHCGKQVDAAVSDPDSDTAQLKTVRGRRQASLWHDAFGMLQFRHVTSSGGERLTDRVVEFVARAGAAAQLVSPFAEDHLAAWCALAGLDVHAALARAEKRAGEGAVIAHFDFAPRRIARSAGRAAAPAGRELAFRASPDDFPYHGFFPAPWPVSPAAIRAFTWPVQCRLGGLHSLRIGLHIDRTGAFVLHRISVAAYSFHNGQIMSPTPLASFGQTLPGDIARTEPDICIDADNFFLREPAAGKSASYILLLRVELQCPPGGEALITPSLRADSPAAAPLILPTLRLAVTTPAWIPIVADPLDESPARHEALLRLNAPSLHTAVAILPDTGADVGAAIRTLLEQLGASFARRALAATVHTQKHMTPSFSVPKATQTVPTQTLAQGTLWPKLFDPVCNYQTVRIGIGVPGAPWPLAGAIIQRSLRGDHADDSEGRFGGPTISVGVWVVAERGALALLGLERAQALDQFVQWVRGAAPLQAWATSCAWLPEFDYYDDYMLTPYETVSQVDWFRLNLKGRLTDRGWLRRRLRFVAPYLWLGWELAEHVNTQALTAFAHVHSIDDGVEIVLRDPTELNRLEKALAPLLPLGVQGAL